MSCDSAGGRAFNITNSKVLVVPGYGHSIPLTLAHSHGSARDRHSIPLRNMAMVLPVGRQLHHAMSYLDERVHSKALTVGSQNPLGLLLAWGTIGLESVALEDRWVL